MFSKHFQNRKVYTSYEISNDVIKQMPFDMVIEKKQLQAGPELPCIA